VNYWSEVDSKNSGYAKSREAGPTHWRVRGKEEMTDRVKGKKETHSQHLRGKAEMIQDGRRGRTQTGRLTGQRRQLIKRTAPRCVYSRNVRGGSGIASETGKKGEVITKVPVEPSWGETDIRGSHKYSNVGCRHGESTRAGESSLSNQKKKVTYDSQVRTVSGDAIRQ